MALHTLQNALRLRHSAPGMPAPPVGKKSSAPMVEVAGRDAKAGSPGSCRVDTANASRRRRIRKGDHPC